MVLVSLAKTYREAIDTLKKNASVTLDELKRKGVQALEGRSGTVSLHGLEPHDSVQVVVTQTALDPEWPEPMLKVKLMFHD